LSFADICPSRIAFDGQQFYRKSGHRKRKL
jgi:hypothetical protein